VAFRQRKARSQCLGTVPLIRPETRRLLRSSWSWSMKDSPLEPAARQAVYAPTLAPERRGHRPYNRRVGGF
jgi:hypothetical protein